MTATDATVSDPATRLNVDPVDTSTTGDALRTARRTAPVRGHLVSERIRQFSTPDTDVSTFYPRQKALIGNNFSTTKYVSATATPISLAQSKHVYSNEQLYHHPSPLVGRSVSYNRHGMTALSSSRATSLFSLSTSPTVRQITNAGSSTSVADDNQYAHPSATSEPPPTTVLTSPATTTATATVTITESIVPSTEKTPEPLHDEQNITSRGIIATSVATVHTAPETGLHDVAEGKEQLSEEVDVSIATEEIHREHTAVTIGESMSDVAEQLPHLHEHSDNSSDVSSSSEQFHTHVLEFSDIASESDMAPTHFADDSNITDLLPETDSPIVKVRRVCDMPLPALPPLPLSIPTSPTAPDDTPIPSLPFSFSKLSRLERTSSVNYGTLKRKLFLDSSDDFRKGASTGHKSITDRQSVVSTLRTDSPRDSEKLALLTTLTESVEELLKLNFDTLAEMDLQGGMKDKFDAILRQTLSMQDLADDLNGRSCTDLGAVSTSSFVEIKGFRADAISSLETLVESFTQGCSQMISDFSRLTEPQANGKYDRTQAHSLLDVALLHFMTVSGTLDSIYAYAGRFVGVNILVKCSSLLDVCVNAMKTEIASTDRLQSVEELQKAVRNSVSAVNVVLAFYKSELKSLPVSFDKGFTLEATGFGKEDCPSEFSMDDYYNKYEMEYYDYGSMFYKTSFFGNKHENYVGYVPSLGGPVIISLMPIVAPTGSVDYWAILRKKDKPDVRLVLTPQEAPNVKRLSKQEKRLVLASIDSELRLSRLVKVVEPAIEKKLISLDSANMQTKFKFGVLYGHGKQSTEEQMLNNEHGSSAFKEFLKVLGTDVVLKGFTGFAAGLDTKSSLTGEKSVYTVWRDHEVMFHVSTMIPFQADDAQQIARKRHIGNDIVCLVFLEEDAQIDLSTFKSQFLHVFIIVRPDTASQPGVVGYRVLIVQNADVPGFGPSLPTPPIFYNLPALRNFLLCKMINGECASYKAPKFSIPHTRTRHTMVDDLVKAYCTAPIARKSDPEVAKAEVREYSVKEQRVTASTPSRYDARKPSIFLGRLRRKSTTVNDQPISKTAVLTRGQQQPKQGDFKHSSTNIYGDTLAESVVSVASLDRGSSTMVNAADSRH